MSLLARIRVPIRNVRQSALLRGFSTASNNQPNSNQTTEPSQSSQTEQSEQSDNQPTTRRYAFNPPGSGLPSAFERVEESNNQPIDESNIHSKEDWLNARDRQIAMANDTYQPPVMSRSVDSCINPYYDESVNYSPFLDPNNARTKTLEEITAAIASRPLQQSDSSSDNQFPRDLPPIYRDGFHTHHLPDSSDRTPAQRAIKAITYVSILAASVYIALCLELSGEAHDADPRSKALNPIRRIDKPHVLTPLREWTHQHLGIGSVRPKKQSPSLADNSTPAHQTA